MENCFKYRYPIEYLQSHLEEMKEYLNKGHNEIFAALIKEEMEQFEKAIEVLKLIKL